MVSVIYSLKSVSSDSYFLTWHLLECNFSYKLLLNLYFSRSLYLTFLEISNIAGLGIRNRQFIYICNNANYKFSNQVVTMSNTSQDAQLPRHIYNSHNVHTTYVYYARILKLTFSFVHRTKDLEFSRRRTKIYILH